jgi:hypothetical protein
VVHEVVRLQPRAAGFADEKGVCGLAAPAIAAAAVAIAAAAALRLLLIVVVEATVLEAAAAAAPAAASRYRDAVRPRIDSPGDLIDGGGRSGK